MSERKDGKKFEPPPWEREQFDELARIRESRRADTEIDSAIQGLNEVTVEPEQGESPATEIAEPGAVVSTTTPPDRAIGRGGEIEEARLLEMLAQLAAEEPRAIDEWWRAGLFGAVVTAAIGLMLIVLGAVGLFRTAQSGPTGLLGGFVLLGFGFGFIGIAAWTVVRTLKQRGVL